MSVNRRDVLKISAVAGAGVAVGTFGVNVGDLRAATRKQKVSATKEYTSACNFCSCGCGMICQVKDGKLVNLEGDPDHVINGGALCSKGAAMAEVPNSRRRLTKPLYRAPGGTKWEEISWNDALAKIAKKMRTVRDSNWLPGENSTEAIGFLGGAQNTNEECYLVSKLARILGTVAVEHQARL